MTARVRLVLLAAAAVLAGGAVTFALLRDPEPGGGSGVERVPAWAAANVTGLDGGVVSRGEFARRAELVTARDPVVQGRTARQQAIDELILNRWMRAEATERGVEIAGEDVAAQLDSPEFAVEADRLRAAGFPEAVIVLDAEARVAAEAIFGPGTQAVVALTGGYGAINDEELAPLVQAWRKRTFCAEDLAPLSPLCANGPEPRRG